MATAQEQNARIHQQVKDARPKLTTEQITLARKKSLKRLRITEIVATALYVGLLVFVQALFPTMAHPDAPSEALFNTFLAYWGVYLFYVAFMIRTVVLRYNHDYMNVSEDASDNWLRGVRIAWFAPLIAFLVLIPSLMSGVFIDSATNNGDIIGISLFALLITTIGAPLVTVFVVTPIEMIVRGVVAMVRRDTSQMHYAWIGLFIAGLTAFIAFGSMAISADLPYPAGSYQAFMALIGVPGGYEIKSEFALWGARAIALFYAVLIGYVIFSRKPKQKNTAS